MKARKWSRIWWMQSPGERILDYAAGAGGKALALAAEMRNQGEIIAFDKFPERMRPLAERAERAGATIIIPVGDDAQHLAPQSFDAVLLDAPCSGSGSVAEKPRCEMAADPDALAQYQAEPDGDAGFGGSSGQARRAADLRNLLNTPLRKRRYGGGFPITQSCISANPT